jgi:DNA-binding response OmpR family regulator
MTEITAAHILVVDDDPILAGFLQLTLELEGYRVAVANDGAVGLDKVARERFDLVLLDLVMPKIDGVKFLRLLNEGQSHRPPIMIVSSAIEEKLTDQHRALGVVDIARKPVETKELVTRVKRALASSIGSRGQSAIAGRG